MRKGRVSQPLVVWTKNCYHNQVRRARKKKSRSSWRKDAGGRKEDRDLELHLFKILYISSEFESVGPCFVSRSVEKNIHLLHLLSVFRSQVMQPTTCISYGTCVHVQQHRLPPSATRDEPACSFIEHIPWESKDRRLLTERGLKERFITENRDLVTPQQSGHGTRRSRFTEAMSALHCPGHYDLAL
jgi:hypothetical protein